MATKLKFRRGDQVVVLTGKDKGKRGEVLRMMREEGRAFVQGVNMVKRHTRPSAMSGGGGIVEKEASIHLSNLSHIDPKTDQPTRAGYKFLKDGRKVRYAKRSGEVLDN